VLQSTDNSNISVIAQNKKCFDNDIVCSKNIFIAVGDSEIYFSELSEKQVSYFLSFFGVAFQDNYSKVMTVKEHILGKYLPVWVDAV